MVNELLIALESYTGVLIATTNRMEALDAACMRRFDRKIRLEWLRSDQVRQLLIACFEDEKIGEIVEQLDFESLNLKKLGPGDIASILRSWQFEPVRSAGRLESLLVQECATKGRGMRRIGFV